MSCHGIEWTKGKSLRKVILESLQVKIDRNRLMSLINQSIINMLTTCEEGPHISSIFSWNKFEKLLDDTEIVKLVELDQTLTAIDEFYTSRVPNVEKLVKFIHKEYEKQAKIAGWKTQESCQVEFDDLPEANKTVMYAVAKSIHKLCVDKLKGV